MAASTNSIKHLGQTYEAQAPLEFSFTFETPKTPLQRRCPDVSPAANVTPALQCIYCGGLYSRANTFNAKQDSRNFVCIHCTKRIEAEVDETNHCPIDVGSATRATQGAFDSGWKGERDFYRKSLGEIKELLELIKSTLPGCDTNCYSRIEVLANEIEKLKHKLNQTIIESPVPSSASLLVLPKNALNETKDSVPSRDSPVLCDAPLLPNRPNSTKIGRRPRLSLRPQRKCVHVIGGPRVGLLKGPMSDLLDGDRRCRFFVHRRASSLSIINATRRRIHHHNPQATEQLIVLHADIQDVLSLHPGLDIKPLWKILEAQLNGLVADCQVKKIKLIICSFPFSVASEVRYRNACEYFNSALHRKFWGTQVIIRDLPQTPAGINKSGFDGPVPPWDDIFSSAMEIASDVAVFLGLPIPALKKSRRDDINTPAYCSKIPLPTSLYPAHRKPFFQYLPHRTLPPPFLQLRSNEILTPPTINHVTHRRPPKVRKEGLHRSLPPRKLTGKLRHLLYQHEY